MGFDRDYCDCPRSGPGHPPLHAVCCRCIFCLECNHWVRAQRWRAHVSQPHEAAQELELPPLPETEELKPDSLEYALQEVSGEDLAGSDLAFRAAVRSCLGELIDHLEQLGGPYRADRTAAWEMVLRTLLDPHLSLEEKVAHFLAQFDQPSDDLEAQLTGVVLSAEELFPQKTLQG